MGKICERMPTSEKKALQLKKPQNTIQKDSFSSTNALVNPNTPKISLEEYDIDPYSVLNIPQYSDHTEIKNAFQNLVISPNKAIKSKACLAYEILFNKNNFVQYGNYYRIKVKDCFYFAIIGDLNSLKSLIESNKNFLHSRDYLQRSLLYLAARNGYFDVTEYLLQKGVNIDEVQSTRSTLYMGQHFMAMN